MGREPGNEPKVLMRQAAVFARHIESLIAGSTDVRPMHPDHAPQASGAPCGESEGPAEEAAPGATRARPEKEIAEVLYRQALLLHGIGKTDLAMRQLRLVLEIDNEHGEAHNDIGVLCHEKGDMEEAVRHLNEALRLDPGNVEYRKNIAGIYLQAGKVEEAVENYRAVLEANPDDVAVLLIVADLCAASGLGENARSLWKRVLEIEPHNERARQSL